MIKTLHIIIAIIAVTPVLGQQTEPATNGTLNNSSAPTTNSIEYNYTITESEELMTDTLTTIEELREESPVPLRKKRAAKAIQSAPVMEIESIPVREVESSEDEMNDATTSGAFGQNLDGAATSSAGYFRASSNFSNYREQSAQQRTQRTPTLSQQVEMDKAVGYFEVNAPNSFEHHYFKYVSGNYDIDLIEHLREAEELRPDNADVHVQMAAFNMIRQETDSANQYIDKLTSSGRLSASTLNYAEDLLLSVPQNGVLVTHGFDDTYGVWKKWKKDGLRSDVTLISLDFLQSAHYRNELKNDGFKLPESEVIDVDYFLEFCALNKDENLSVSMTTPKEYLAPLQSNLFVTGLVFEYHEEDFNNFDRNDILWNETLKKKVINNATDNKSRQLSSNYLPMLLQLRKVYGQKGEEVKLKDVDLAADKVGLQCKKYEQVQQLKKSY